MKILKSRKALSPVVASIILIAVTVAVSIAVAAWMGALTFGFMATEQLDVGQPRAWTANMVTINVTNTGSGKVTLSGVEVSGTPATFDITWRSGTQGLNLNTLDAGERAAINITYSSGFTAGTAYNFAIISSSNKRYTTTGAAPQ
jgi:flagellin-like protein